MRQMLKWGLRDAGLPDTFSTHSFRVPVVTDLLTRDVSLETVRNLVGHAAPGTA